MKPRCNRNTVNEHQTSYLYLNIIAIHSLISAPDSMKAAKNSRKSVFAQWYSSFPDEDDTPKSAPVTPVQSPQSARVSSRLAQKEKDSPMSATKRKHEEDKPTASKKTPTKEKEKDNKTEVLKGSEKKEGATESRGLAAGRSKRTIIKKKFGDEEEEDVTPKRGSKANKKGNDKELEEDTTPRRGRGRPKKTEEEKEESDKDIEEDKAPKRGRGRSRKSIVSEEKERESDEEIEENKVPKRGRGPRKSGASEEKEQESGQETEEDDADKAKKRGKGRQRNSSKSEEKDEKSDEEVEEDESPKKGRGRPRKTSARGGKEDESDKEIEKEDESSKKGRGRPRQSSAREEKEEDSDKEMEEEDATPKRGRGRPRKNSVREEKEESDKGAEKEDTTQEKGKGRSRKISTEDEKESEKEKETEDATPKRGRGRPRKFVSNEEKEKESEKETDDTSTPQSGQSKKISDSDGDEAKEGGKEAEESEEMDKGDEKEKEEAGKGGEKETEEEGIKRGQGGPRTSTEQVEKDKDESPAPKRGRGRPKKIHNEHEKDGESADTVQAEKKVIDKGTPSKPEQAVADATKQASSTVITACSQNQVIECTLVEVDNTPARKSSRLAEIRIKEEPDTSEYERRASGRKKAVFECSECQETFFMEYLLNVHMKKCRREARLMSPKSATPATKTKKKVTENKAPTPKDSSSEKIVQDQKAILMSVKKEKAELKEDEGKADATVVDTEAKQKEDALAAVEALTSMETVQQQIPEQITVVAADGTTVTHTFITATEHDAELIEQLVKAVEAEVPKESDEHVVSLEGVVEEQVENTEEGMEEDDGMLEDDDSDWGPEEDGGESPQKNKKPVKRKRVSSLDGSYQPKRPRNENRKRALKYKEIKDILNFKPQGEIQETSAPVEIATNEEEIQEERQEEGKVEESTQGEVGEGNAEKVVEVHVEVIQAPEGVPSEEIVQTSEDVQVLEVVEEDSSKAKSTDNSIVEDMDYEEPGEDDYLDVSTIESMVDLDSNVCAICDMKFKDAKYMRRHLITHSATKNYTCQVCTKRFMRRYDLHQHLVRIHAWVKTGRGRVIDQNKIIREKAQQVKKERTEEEREEDEDGRVGEEVTEDGEIRALVEQAIEEAEELEEGEVPVHGREEGEVIVETTNPDDPGEEQKLKILEDDNVIIDNRRKQIGVFICGFCNIICNTRLSLDQHLERVHEDEMGFECKDCDAKFNKYAKLQRHISASHTEKRYGCSVCGKLFKYFYTCKEHEKIHTDNKAHLCDYCGKAFSLLVSTLLVCIP